MDDNTVSRACNTCGAEYPRTTEFWHKDGRLAQGLSYQCKGCKSGWPKPKPTLEERFWAKVEKTEACWLWTSTVVSEAFPYGQISDAYKGKKRTRLAHRLSYEMHYGAIPDDLKVLHSCDNPRCVNPIHLWLGTSLDNARDCVQKQRHVALRGAEHANARLTEENVRDIKQSYKKRVVTLEMLARKYDVSPSTVHYILQGKLWRHVEV